MTYEDANGTAYDSQRSASCDAGLSADESFNAVIDGKPTYSSSIQLLDVDFTAGGAFACYSNDTYVSTPQMASDSPSDIAGDVMSLYSDYYAPEVARGAVNNMEVITWDASWGPADTGEVDMGGNMVRYYTSSYTGIDVQPVDLTSYDMMHIDLWAQNGGEFNVKLVDFAGDGYAGANPDTAGEIVFTHDVSSWKSVDIALADFMDATKVLDPAVVLGAMSDINQIVVVSSGTTYLDNFYFYQSDALSTAELNELFAELGYLQYRTFGYGHSFGVLSHFYGREAGLELCTGGIIGLGETREQRIEMTLELAKIYPEEVTINILVPVPGTPLELQVDLPNSEITRIFSVIRFLLPESVIKISGGRETNLEDSGEELLQSGANGIITQGYLTMDGNNAQKDRNMIEKIG